jgi:hypothetical protein
MSYNLPNRSCISRKKLYSLRQTAIIEGGYCALRRKAHLPQTLRGKKLWNGGMPVKEQVYKREPQDCGALWLLSKALELAAALTMPFGYCTMIFFDCTDKNLCVKIETRE